MSSEIGERPTLSVVIPTHDTRDLTLACLAALARATAKDLSPEIVVVDDASSDGTAEAIADLHPEVLVLRCDRASGFTHAANLGLSRTHGEVLLLLNSDTELAPGGPEALLRAFADDPHLGAAGALLHYPDGTPQWSGGSAPTLLWLFGLGSGLPALLARLPLYRRLKPPGRGQVGGPVDWVTGAALALRRPAWEQVGPLEESFRFYAQDLDLCLRLRSAGWNVAVVPDFPVLHHHGATIGRRPGADGPQHPELLWHDLLHWAQLRRTPTWARAARLALLTGVRLRLAARSLALPFLPAARRPGWRLTTRRLGRALYKTRRALP